MRRMAATEPSDEALACRAQSGCADSFEELMVRYQAPVLQFLRHRSRLSDAEDLLQETFVRAYVNLHRYRPRWRFATWLFTIARRVGINHARRALPVADSGTLRFAVAATPGPLQAMVAEEHRRDLWALAAGALGEEEFTAVWLYYVEELSAREIASVLERSWVSVKTMLFRARRKLRPLVEPLEPETTARRRRISDRLDEAGLTVEGSHV
jgi:RNA polymerase sigma-70 factor (ECF subfamily)